MYGLEEALLAQCNPIFQAFKEFCLVAFVGDTKTLSKGFFYECLYFISCFQSVRVHAQFAHIAIERSNGSHICEYCCLTFVKEWQQRRSRAFSSRRNFASLFIAWQAGA
jgi:hypothetical protein